MKHAPPTSDASSAEVRAKHKQYILPAVANYYAEPIVPESAAGARLCDLDGRTYLDFFGGILTIGVGHCDPRVNEPLKAQIDRLGHVSSLYPNLPAVELAERLAQLAPGRLQKSVFTNSGTEADETAVVLAQVYTGAQEIIALRHGYAGRSTLAQSLTAQAPWRALPTQVASVKHAPAPYCYRCPLGLAYPSCEVRCARDIEELIRTTTTGRVAGLIAEPVLGVGGVITPPSEYFQIAVEIVRRHGGVFVCDEVQAGVGRTGKLFAIEHYGVEPEILTMAKAIANGMPLAVTIATPEIADAFKSMTISTFGGNPLSCAAALATLDVMEQDDLPGNAARMGERLIAGLREIQRRHPRSIGEVRGKGLMVGIELVADETRGDRTPNPALVQRVMEETKQRGLLIGKGGLYGNVLRLGPPLSIGASEVDEALAILGQAFQAAAA
jgi:4-aminobutyrate aminotransferase-like enzyme